MFLDGGRVSLSKDISLILSGWAYDPEDLEVRIVAGDDGRDKIQMRVDLGLIQMETSGRPDGSRPEGHESLLEFYETGAMKGAGSSDSFVLDPKACMALMREGLQYYHRYLAAFHLERYDLVVRDTERNLRLFAFAVKHAARPQDKMQFDQYRPYVVMMRSRALAHQARDHRDFKTALAVIDHGIESIRQYLNDYNRSDEEATFPELNSLLRLRREVESERPVGPVERLEQQLAKAVEREKYEEAARLRDQLIRLKGEEVTTRPPTS